MPPNASKTIFVANIPYDVSEEQLASTFSEAGPVANVEIKFDPTTGRSKGYAFVSFYDESTALSAVRNLQDAPVNGRNLRVELSTDEPGPRRRGPPVPGTGLGPTAPAGPTGPGNGTSYGMTRPQAAGGYPGSQPSGARYADPRDNAGGGREDVDLRYAPQGVEIPAGEKATDTITKVLAAVSPGQMQEVMTNMKNLVTTNPDAARQLLNQQPQLAYAIFQAMLLLNIVDPSVLQSITPLPPKQAATTGPVGGYPPFPPAQAAPQSNYPSYPPQPPQGFRPPQQVGYANTPPHGYPSAPATGSYGGPPQASTPVAAPAPVVSGMAGLPPAAQAALSTLPKDQQQMLIQVLLLSPDQISALDATQKASVMQLRQQFLGV